MNVFLDDNLIDSSFLGAATTVEEALRHIQENLCPAGQMVVGVRCDEQEVASDSLGAALHKPAKSFQRLDVITGTKGRLVVDAMSQASSCLTDTESACREAADHLKNGDTAKATETLGECLRIWQQIHEAVAKSMTMLAIDPETTMVNDVSVLDLVKKPTAALVQMRDALRSKDFVLLADILEYEFGDVTDFWHSVIGKLHQEAQDTLESETAPKA